METPAFRPGGNAGSPPRKCQRYSIVCSHVPVSAVPRARPGGGAAGPLRPCPVRVEPRGGAARALAPGPGGRAGLPGAVPAAHRGPGRSTRGWPRARRWCSSRRCGISPRRWPRSSTRRTRPGARRGARPAGTRGSGSSAARAAVGRAAADPESRRVWVPKAGWVRFRWSRAVPPGVKSYRVTMDRAGRWHVAFAASPSRSPHRATGRSSASTGAWRWLRPCRPGSCCTSRA